MISHVFLERDKNNYYEVGYSYRMYKYLA